MTANTALRLPVVAETVGELREVLTTLPAPVVLVPTMGALHEGHAALARAAMILCASLSAGAPCGVGPVMP